MASRSGNVTGDAASLASPTAQPNAPDTHYSSTGRAATWRKSPLYPAAIVGSDPPPAAITSNAPSRNRHMQQPPSHWCGAYHAESAVDGATGGRQGIPALSWREAPQQERGMALPAGGGRAQHRGMSALSAALSTTGRRHQHHCIPAHEIARSRARLSRLRLRPS